MPKIEKAGRSCLEMASWTRRIEKSALQEMLAVCTRPDIISFALGLPEPRLFPVPALARAFSSVLEKNPSALQYGPPSRTLKSHVVKLMKQRGVDCREEQVFITAGAQQGMNLIARLLLESGGSVLVEELIYTGLLQVIEPFQPDILTVRTDLDSGIDVDGVERILERGRRPGFIYAVTHGHNPLGVCMSAEKRLRLVELAGKYGVPIVEDDAYGFLNYDGSGETPIRALDDQHVIYVGSFSKILAPALRVGWLVAPEALMPNLSIVKEATDIDTITLTQQAVLAVLEEGYLPEHIERLRAEYSRRRDTMLETLREVFPEGARWRKPTCGVFIWLEVAEMLNTSELLKTAVESQKVAYIPGNAFCAGPSRPSSNCMRLNFSNPDPAQIREGISRLATVLRGAMAGVSATA
jgi:2-aminoadipate transaminase